MKRWFTVAAAVVLSLALVIGIACGGGDGDDDGGVTTLKYGCGAPLTGYMSAIGYAVKYCMGMAAEDIGVFEVGGKQYRWEVKVEDNMAATVEGGAVSARKLIYEHHVDVMGQGGENAAMGARAITEEVPMILELLGGSASQIGPDFPYTFATLLVFDVTIPAVVDWLVTEHPDIKRIAVTYEETGSGLAVREIWKKTCEHYGLEFNSVLAPAATVEWYPIATKMMTWDPDVVTGGWGTGLTQAMWDFGYDGFFLSNYWQGAMGTGLWDDLAEKNRFGKGHIVFAVHAFAGAFPRLDAFKDEYERRYGKEMGVEEGWMFNGLYYLTDVVKQAGTADFENDLDKIVQTLEGSSFDTLVGQMHYGLEDYAGIPHVGVWPVPIFEIVGENDYKLHKIYTDEEAEAKFREVYGY